MFRVVLATALTTALVACASTPKEEPKSAADETATAAEVPTGAGETTVEVNAPTESTQAAIAAPEDVAAPPADAVRTDSGLAYRVLQAGTATAHPGATSTVRVHYTGWTTDGQMFDSSVARGEPISFPLDRVISGWTEGVQLMVEGEKSRFWIPAELAYGETPSRPGAPAGMLVFDIELLAIE